MNDYDMQQVEIKNLNLAAKGLNLILKNKNLSKTGKLNLLNELDYLIWGGYTSELTKLLKTLNDVFK
jgi:hypothetical protein